jgi:hypothetical protein
MVWDDKEIKDTIDRELGWQKAEDGSTDHVDCLFAPVKNYLVVQKWGLGEKTTKYSAMVRAGQISREEAQEKARGEESGTQPEVVEAFVDLSEMSKDDVEAGRQRDFRKYL